MGLFRPDRSRRTDGDPFLLWKVRLFVLGGGLGIVGMMIEWGPLLWVGIAVLMTGVGLRFADRSGEDGNEAWDGDPDR